MTYRRRMGRRFKARKKVTRAEMVKFYRVAGQKERVAVAHAQAERLARWIKGAVIVAAALAIGLLAWRSM